MAKDESFTVQAARRKLRRGAVVSVPDVELTFCTIHGRPVRFATDLQRDPIQRNHRAGRFYEQPELDSLRHFVPAGATFVDIGANVGNHSLYAGLFLAAAKVIPFEPNPLAYRLLMTNVLLNGLESIVSFDHIGLGLSDHEASGFGMEARNFNLGAAKMLEGEGEIELSTGDIRLADESPDFIKIDVEGMEMGVLRGLRETVARAKPNMLIEVDEENYDAFDAWVEEVGYTKVETFQRYRNNKNFLIQPQDAE